MATKIKDNKNAIKDIWMNLPVKNAKKSKVFFKKLGFKFNPNYEQDEKSCCLQIGDKGVVVMLFEHDAFKGFSGQAISDVKKGTEVLLSISAESRKQVDAFAKKVKVAGGVVFSKPAEYDGWMYGCGFKDLDGHRWNMLYMDMSKMSQ